MNPLDSRWIQRLQNFKKAFANLKSAVALTEQRALSDLEKQGLIHAFKFTYELAWNTVKDFYQFQGEEGLQGSRDAFRTAFQLGLVQD
ncbi:nucleotidyltransferase substrate binding protein [Bowmanella dokdonensis]|uniref:Nucleotidyltransferase substrate binding protein n=1 Tax=Bowmanella dokdonensis TaxID=751969 RepID=A0A939DNC0_9ALTE|nr:nucleotidyltransferase substrate binding protein [Bowmanella dokdonensis]